MTDRIIYDIETYPNVFTLAAEHADYPIKWSFEISPWHHDGPAIYQWFLWMLERNVQMVGFNNVGFDYPVIHILTRMNGIETAERLYAKAMQIIGSQDTGPFGERRDDRFKHMVKPSDRMIPQIDLFKIHHFDNRSKSTSLKALEFNMRMDNVEDLPFPVGTVLNPEQIKVLRQYNQHDVTATKRFFHESLSMIEFREQLSVQYGRDFLNYNDTKIGAEIFQIELEKVGVECYEYGPNGRQPRQTERTSIALYECIPDYIHFYSMDFDRVYQWLRTQTITETKGVFKDLKATVRDLDYVFGTGGLHASVDHQHFVADDQMMIADIDVAGMYPAIAIANGYYPEHLGPTFVEVYKQVRDKRASFKKGTPQNAALKLAGNGVYGKSNDQFSIFFDPKFTMKVTLTGQLSIAMLADRLSQVPGLTVIQCNTDGITAYLPRASKAEFDSICRWWEGLTKLTLEEVEYSRMFVADVNSYIAEKLNGEVKRKGRYEWDQEWHQNDSCLVVPKVAEQHLLHGAPIADTVRAWPDIYDFLSRVKVPRASKLHGVFPHGEYQLQNMTRYYVSVGGCELVKIMPPLAKKPTQWRRIGVESGWKVTPCNDIRAVTMPINYDYYIREVEKLCLPMK